MAEKDNNTYDNIHSRLSEAIEDVYLNDVLKDVKEPDVDLSFLAEGKNQKKNYKRLLRISAIAAIVIVVLLGTNIVLLSGDNMDAYGDKGILHRLYEGINGIFTDEDDSVETDVTDMFEITEVEDLDKAKEFFNGLYIPRHIPEGYQFSNLTIEKYNSGDTVCIYNYTNENGRRLEISCMHCVFDDANYGYQGDGEIIELDDRTLYMEWDDVQKEYYLTVYTEDATMNIWVEGYDNKGNIIAIGSNMMK